jgi:hypothetical protein
MFMSLSGFGMCLSGFGMSVMMAFHTIGEIELTRGRIA